MATVAEVKAGILSFSGTDLDNATLAGLVTLYNESWGSQWANPWDENDNPAEYAAWPTNEELAQFFAEKTVSEWKSRIWRAKKAQEGQNNEAVENAAAQAEADKLG